jgi:hypothetical protein
VAQVSQARERVYERLEAMDNFAWAHNAGFSDGEWNVVGSYYNLIMLNGESIRSNVGTLAMMGNPVTVAFQQPQVGSPSDIYHPAGSQWDYVLLGQEYRELAPTAWIGERTIFGREIDSVAERRAPYDMSFCFGSSMGLLCGVRASILNTLLVPRLAQAANPKVVDLPDGGTELRMAIPFGALSTVDDFPNYPSLFPAEDMDTILTDEMTKQPLMVRVWQTAEGEPTRVEVNGRMVDGQDTITLQAGWEKIGEATESDFPVPPESWDVTYLNDEEFEVYSRERDRIRQELRGESS